MPYIVRCIAAVSAPTLAIVAWIFDSTDDRQERARLNELNWLRRQFEGPGAQTTHNRSRAGYRKPSKQTC